MMLHEGDPERVASVLPDAVMSIERAVVHFTIGLLAEAGWTVRLARWSQGHAASAEEVAAESGPFLEGVDSPMHLVVGFSLGSAGVAAAVERSLPAIWIRPHLREERVRAGMDATLEPGLLVGGSADVQWDSVFAKTTRLQVHDVKDADAALEIPDSVKDSIKSLTRTLKRIEDFIHGLEA